MSAVITSIVLRARSNFRRLLAAVFLSLLQAACALPPARVSVPAPAAGRATQVALEAIQALGGNGYINEYPAGRLLRDAKLYEIGAGTQEIRRILIGRELFDAVA